MSTEGRKFIKPGDGTFTQTCHHLIKRKLVRDSRWSVYYKSQEGEETVVESVNLYDNI